MHALLTDLRIAFRLALHQPGFTILVVLTLALGVGANTAIFSAVNGLLLRPAPFREPDRLVRISVVRGEVEGPVAVPDLCTALTWPEPRARQALHDLAIHRLVRTVGELYLPLPTA